VRWALPPSEANLVWLDETDSTNALAARLVAAWLEGEHARLGDTLLMTAVQRAGRGRGEHRWESPLGGVYVTWLGWVTRQELSWVPLAAGVSLCESIEGIWSSPAIGLKWPNDLLIAGRKVGGILCQARGAGEEAWAAVGFGVNVAVTPQLEGAGGVTPGSLQEVGFGGDAASFERELAALFAVRFRSLLPHPEETRQRWLSRSVVGLGELVRVRTGSRLLEGRFGGLEMDGRLVVETGQTRTVVSTGEIVSPL